MKKKTLLIGCIVLAVLCCIVSVIGTMALGSLPIYSSQTNINGQEVTTYSSQKYYTEMSDKVEEFYAIVNGWKVAQSAESKSLAEIKKAQDKLQEITALQLKVDKVNGEGVEDYDNSITEWVMGYKAVLANEYTQLAKLLGEDARADSQAQYNQANSILDAAETKTDDLTKKINDAADKFYNENN
jgi:hypothetical protein